MACMVTMVCGLYSHSVVCSLCDMYSHSAMTDSRRQFVITNKLDNCLGKTSSTNYSLTGIIRNCRFSCYNCIYILLLGHEAKELVATLACYLMELSGITNHLMYVL